MNGKITHCFITLLTILTLATTSNASAQVGIGTTTPANGALLDIESSDKGVLIPRVALTGTNDTGTITPSATVGLLVFNTATTTGANSVDEGFYYWNGTEWVAISTAAENIYTNDGTLEEERIVSQEDKRLEFTSNVGRNAITIKRTENDTETGIGFRNSGNAYDAAIFMESPNGRGLAIATEGNEQNVADLSNTAVFNENGTSSFGESISVYETDANVGDKTAELYSQNDDGVLEIYENNGMNHRLHGNGTTIFNNQQLDLDFRVATDDNANTLYVNGNTNNIGIKTNNPQEELHVAGNNSTIRIDGLNAANNADNDNSDPAPVYVDNNGNLQLQPPLTQNYMLLNERNFTNGVNITSNNGDGVTTTLLTRTFTLTQESIINIGYQFSVQITRANGNVLVDGASRIYRGWVEFNSDGNHLAYDTGTYTNNPANPGGTYASGYYYLNGSGYVVLPAGTHTVRLRALGFGGEFDFRMRFGETVHDNLQLTVNR